MPLLTSSILLAVHMISKHKHPLSSAVHRIEGDRSAVIAWRKMQKSPQAGEDLRAQGAELLPQMSPPTLSRRPLLVHHDGSALDAEAVAYVLAVLQGLQGCAPVWLGCLLPQIGHRPVQGVLWRHEGR